MWRQRNKLKESAQQHRRKQAEDLDNLTKLVETNLYLWVSPRDRRDENH